MEHLLGGGLFSKPVPSPGEPGEPSAPLLVPEPSQAVPVPISAAINYRPLGKRKHAQISDTTSASFIKVLARAQGADAKVPQIPTKRKNRPLLTELFRPKMDGDLSLYEQHARHVRSFFYKWSKHIDSEDETGTTLPKLLIVSGVTGTGKTATIEVTAQKFGFRLVDLSPNERFRTDLINATTTASENTGQVPEKVHQEYKRNGITRPWYTSGDKIVWDSRPACVLLDVDGLVGADAHRFQKDILAATYQARRPIVLVLNNRYAPCVSELRTRFFTCEAPFYRPSLFDLRKHLLKQADRNDINLKRNLESVLETCDGDIRASLIALQFSFVHSTGVNSGPSAATALLNDKHPSPDLDTLGDNDLRKLFDRVFDYSLETDVCWDMQKVAEIGEWNALCDWHDSDDLRRATMLKYRSLFKSGKKLASRPLPNDFEVRQKVREVLTSCYHASKCLSKQALRLETLPLVASMCVKAHPEFTARLLWDTGVRNIEKTQDGFVLHPDITMFGNLHIDPAVLTVFDSLKEVQQEYTVGAVQRRNMPKAKKDSWLKPKEVDVAKLAAGVWLDFKASDENQAKKPIGLRELLA